MKNLFMKHIEKQQFELLKQLIYSEHGMTAHEIMAHLDISIHTVYRYQQQLAEDLTLLFENQSVMLKKTNSCYAISIDPSIDISYVIDKMHLHYIKKSQQFSVLHAVTYRYYSSAESLAQEVNLSLSHTYKNLKISNELLKPFGVSVGFSAESSQTNFQGNEKNLRMVLFYSYWSIFKGIEWPFFRAPKLFCELPAPIKNNLLPPSQKIRLSYYQSLTYWQMIYRKRFVAISEDFLAYLDLFEEVSPVTFPAEIKDLLYKNHVSQQQIHQEEAYFGFLARFYIANIDSMEDKLKIVDTLIASKLPLTNFTSTFLNSFLTTFKITLTEERYVSNYYHILFNLLYIQFFGIHAPFSQLADELPLVDKTPDPLFAVHKEALTQFAYEQLQQELFPTIDKDSTLIQYLTKLLHVALTNATKHQKLNILIQYSKTSYGYDLIKNNLSIIFGKDTLEFTFDEHAADIIISDAFEHELHDVERSNTFFYFEYPYNTHVWQELILFISKHLYSNFA
ncbi:helix-turn-helix domain-containing protein [Enterococcus crotali]|uniref:helix-turn-helix domain-containing protein n=1 Tax=Enterococcus crotali TaxID=1453587 RepID=UPI00046F89EA|nr:helix-turn-helix domain-containing protein [Enterococcus crotali]